VGRKEGEVVGVDGVGINVGRVEGLDEGVNVGVKEGKELVGRSVGVIDGAIEGTEVGIRVCKHTPVMVPSAKTCPAKVEYNAHTMSML